MPDFRRTPQVGGNIMLLNRKLVAVLTAALALSATLVLAQGDGKGKGKAGDGKAKGGPPALQALTVSTLKPGLFLITGDGGNSTVRVTKDGLIVTDTKNLGDPGYAQLAAEIKKISPLPVKYVFITHHHQDHSGNNGRFGDAKVVAHEGLIKNLATYAPAQGKPGVPNTPYKDKYAVKLGGARVVAYHFKPAHTGGDSIVHFPDLNVVQCGDVVVGIAPNIDFPFGGSGVTWLDTLNKIDKLKWDTLVPGHSAPNATTMSRAEFAAYKMKWETLIGRAVAEVKKGTSKEQLLAAIKTDDIGWNVNTPQWQAANRLDPFYAELKAAGESKKK
jgi:glyoxylase-like metal-dependent hydrolase (beta-lactamase superfamily II)